MCANFIIGNIYVNGTPSVKMVQYHRDGGSVFPCRWITLSGIYTYDVTGALHVLFDLERYYGLCPEMKNGKIIFSFGEKPEWAVPTDPKDTEMLKIMTEKWIQVRDELKSGAITDDDYFVWESRYPENAVTQKPINDSRKRKKPKDK